MSKVLEDCSKPRVGLETPFLLIVVMALVSVYLAFGIVGLICRGLGVKLLKSGN